LFKISVFSLFSLTPPTRQVSPTPVVRAHRTPWTIAQKRQTSPVAARLQKAAHHQPSLLQTPRPASGPKNQTPGLPSTST